MIQEQCRHEWLETVRKELVRSLLSVLLLRPSTSVCGHVGGMTRTQPEIDNTESAETLLMPEQTNIIS